MTATLTPRQIAFLQNYHASFNLVEAYRSAGLKPLEGQTIVQAAAEILGTQVAKEYLLTLQAPPEETEATKGEVIVKELTAIALSRLTDVCSWDAQGNVRFTPASELADSVQAAVETLRVEATQFGPKVMVKMHSKHAALSTLSHYYNVDCDLNSLLDRVRSYNYEPMDMSESEDGV